jgi:SAM domain (Sterile alpha motif)
MIASISRDLGSFIHLLDTRDRQITLPCMDNRGVAARARARTIRTGIPRQRHRWRCVAELTTEDLKDLGIASVGHRRRLLEAIAAPSRPVMAGYRGSRAGKAFDVSDLLPDIRRLWPILLPKIGRSTSARGKFGGEQATASPVSRRSLSKTLMVIF